MTHASCLIHTQRDKHFRQWRSFSICLVLRQRWEGPLADHQNCTERCPQAPKPQSKLWEHMRKVVNPSLKKNMLKTELCQLYALYAEESNKKMLCGEWTEQVFIGTYRKHEEKAKHGFIAFDSFQMTQIKTSSEILFLYCWVKVVECCWVKVFFFHAFPCFQQWCWPFLWNKDVKIHCSNLYNLCFFN